MQSRTDDINYIRHPEFNGDDRPEDIVRVPISEDDLETLRERVIEGHGNQSREWSWFIQSKLGADIEVIFYPESEDE